MTILISSFLECRWASLCLVLGPWRNVPRGAGTWSKAPFEPLVAKRPQWTSGEKVPLEPSWLKNHRCCVDTSFTRRVGRGLCFASLTRRTRPSELSACPDLLNINDGSSHILLTSLPLSVRDKGAVLLLPRRASNIGEIRVTIYRGAQKGNHHVRSPATPTVAVAITSNTWDKRSRKNSMFTEQIKNMYVIYIK